MVKEGLKPCSTAELDSFFSKPKLSPREAKWLEFLGQFGTTSLTLVKGLVYVPGDTLSRTLHIIALQTAPVNAMEVHTAAIKLLEGLTEKYICVQVFAPIFSALNGKLSKDPVQEEWIARLLPHFTLQKGVLLYNNKICVPRPNFSETLKLAHHCLTSWHFFYLKSLSRLNGLYWKSKEKDTEAYCLGCHTCHMNSDSRIKPLGTPSPLELPDRLWAYIAVNFITHLSMTANRFD